MLADTPMTPWLFGWLVCSGVVLVLICMQLVGARFERRPVSTFIRVPEGEEPELSAYALAMCEAAVALGFRAHGMGRHGTHKNVYASLWLSPGSEVMALVGTGKLGGMRFRKTMLFSRLADGSHVVTVDEFGPAELSGIWACETLMNADLYELFDFHWQRLVDAGVEVVPFAGEDLWQEYAEMEAQRTRRLVDLGHARYVGPEQASWRYTFGGSVRVVWQQYLSTRAARKQRKRAKIKRPGDRKYVPSARAVPEESEVFEAELVEE